MISKVNETLAFAHFDQFTVLALQLHNTPIAIEIL